MAPHSNIGDRVDTIYGIGTIRKYRSKDGMYQISLEGPMIQTTASNSSLSLNCAATLFTLHPTVQSAKLSSSVVDAKQQEQQRQEKHQLNVAYEAYEKMRKLNLEVECIEAGIVFTKNFPIDYDVCTECLLQKGPKKKAFEFRFPQPSIPNIFSNPWKTATHSLSMEDVEEAKINEELARSKFSPDASPRIPDKNTNSSASGTKENDQRKRNNVESCLLCGSPTCTQHSSKSFRREGITLCLLCMECLEFEFPAHDQDDNHPNLNSFANGDHDEDNEECCLKSNKFLTHRIHRLVDLYDRALLLLKFSSPSMIPAAESLEESQKHRNHVRASASSVGCASGALGVAAACSFLTPAGPPLLIASLVFGGSATVVHAGSGAVRYWSEPRQWADRMLALYGMVQSLLKKVTMIRDTTLVPYLDEAVNRLVTQANFGDAFLSPNISKTEQDDTVQKALGIGVRIGGKAALSQMAITSSTVVQETAAAGRFITKMGTNLVPLATRLAQFTGGALSAATFILEVRELTQTIQQIQMGSPCDKADALRQLHAKVASLPSTQSIDSMFQSYVEVRSKQLARRKLLEKQRELEVSFHNEIEDESLLVKKVVSSLEAHEWSRNASPRHNDPYAPGPDPWGKNTQLSLLERVLKYKEGSQSKDPVEVGLVV